jgi:hypothetical protein
VQKDLRRAIACVNTGEPLKALAAYTERWIANFLTEQGGIDDDLIAGLQVDRDLQPENYLQILSFGDAVRLPDDLQLIQDSDLPPIETPTPVSDPFVMPAGDELFTHDQEEVQKDLRRAIACVNTGEPLKALAAYTERWIANFLTQQGGIDDDLIAGLQVDRDLQPENYLQILSFGDAVRLPDDRIAIVVTGDDPADADPPEARLFLMAEVRPGRFLIDEVIPIPGS